MRFLVTYDWADRPCAIQLDHGENIDCVIQDKKGAAFGSEDGVVLVYTTNNVYRIKQSFPNVLDSLGGNRVYPKQDAKEETPPGDESDGA